MQFNTIWQAGCLRWGGHTDKAEATCDKADPQSERSPA